MSKKERLVTKRVNFYDGHRITEQDLDSEQINNNAIVSNLASDFHGSGIVRGSPFEEVILLDTRFPSKYCLSGENPSQFYLESGSYDGRGITLDRQPTDPVKGSRVEFELVNTEVMGKKRTKILILGRAFDGENSQGELVAEFLEFYKNTKLVTKKFYTSIIAVFFNNFSGGIGKTYEDPEVESLNLISKNNGYMIVRVAPPLSAYPSEKASYQIESPNFDINNYISSSVGKSMEEEIEIALGPNNNINDLYIELEGSEKLKFEKSGLVSISYGQKFLSKVNNIQRVDLLLSVEGDTTLPLENKFDFSGDLVVSIHELVTSVVCSSDAVPDDLIDFDPEVTPLAEVSFSQEDLETLGYKLNDTPQVVSFNFAGTLIADPNIDPSIKKDKYYAILISRRGNNQVGTVIVEKGFDKVYKKSDLGVPLTVLERFGKQQSKYIEYDPITKRFINDSNSSLWYVIHTDAIEVTDGTAYTDSGIAVTVPKTTDFVGSTQISYFERYLNLRTVAEGSDNYLVLSQQEAFSDPNVHPRTNNFVFTRVLDAPSFSVVNSEELQKITSESIPLLLAKINDNNVRSAYRISGLLDKPGLIGLNTITIVNPSQDLLNSNLINRVVTPDINCNCNYRYRIVKVECKVVKAGDLNDDKELTTTDLGEMLNLVGNTINSEETERKILNREIDVVDFIKADLNLDGSVDGTDIEILENAIDGYINFSIPEEFKTLTLYLENILEENNYPRVFLDDLFTGSTAVGASTATFTSPSKEIALAISVGDVLTLDDPGAGSQYLIASKEIAPDGYTVTLSVTDLFGEETTFNGSTGLNFEITSRSEVNLFADNPKLLSIPFSSFEFEIDFIDAPYQSSFVEIYDLRRFVGSSFIEEKDGSCQCVETDCLPTNEASPIYKNQTYIPGDLYIPDGNILSAPGVPHHGDFEYTNIKIPLPPGSITNCSVDLYSSFLKSKDGSCLTAAGFPAMRYSDGTLVGCEDIGSNTDITKGRVKFSTAVASICVDALVDGYIDGYTDLSQATDTSSAIEVITENFIDASYNAFNNWTLDGLNDPIVSISNPAIINTPAIFELTTSSNTGKRFGRLNSPASVQNFTGDFVVDFKATRTTWPSSSLINGAVYSFATLEVVNANTTATLNLGWKIIAGYTTKLFYGGVIKNNLNTIISTFNFEVDAPDVVGDDVLFRFRRINDVISAYYVIPDKLFESTVDSFGQYIKIGTNPEMHPGTGPATMSFEINQENAPTAGLSFFVRLSEVIFNSSYTTDSSPSSLTLGRDSLTSVVDRAIITLPFSLPRKTNIVSATLVFTSETTDFLTDFFNIIPLVLLNADNIGKWSNIPLEQDLSLMKSFSPGSIVSGSEISIDITSLYTSLQIKLGHLPGFIKGLVIEPDADTTTSFTISSNIKLVVEYLDDSTGMIFKVGIDLNPNTGIATFNTRNILFDAMTKTNRTVLNFGVYLKKAGFKNKDIELSVDDLSRIGIGSCFESPVVIDDQCYFITGSTEVGVFVEGPFPCTL
jgi:hypothetical protein